MNLRKTKSGQAASKLKPPKFSQELSFLVPYLNDEEERRSNLSPRNDNNNDETQLDALSDSSNLDNNILSDSPSPLSIQSATSTRTVGRKSSFAASQASQGPTAANVLQEYLTKTEQHRNQSDPLLHFFISMAKTVKTFPLQDQIHIKAQLFQMVNSVEMRLATTPINPDSNAMEYGSNERERVRIVSNVMLNPAPTRSSTTMFNSPAINKITPIKTTSSAPSTSKTLYVMSPPSAMVPQPSPPAVYETLRNQSPATSPIFSYSSAPNEMPPEDLHAVDQNTQILSQYLHFNKNYTSDV